MHNAQKNAKHNKTKFKRHHLQILSFAATVCIHLEFEGQALQGLDKLKVNNLVCLTKLMKALKHKRAKQDKRLHKKVNLI